MKILPLLLTLFLSCHWSFAGQPDAGVTSVGEWSDPVRDADGHNLRGRLVVCDDRPASNHARVYLELEHGGSNLPVEVYYDINIGDTALNLQLHDAHDHPVPPKTRTDPRPQPPLLLGHAPLRRDRAPPQRPVRLRPHPQP